MTGSLKLGFFLLAAFCAAFAADITGRWKGPMEATGSDVVFEFRSQGTQVTGNMFDADGKPHPITKGTLDGDKLSLTVASEWQGSPVILLVNGTVSAGTIKMAIQNEGGEWSTNAVLKRQ